MTGLDLHPIDSGAAAPGSLKRSTGERQAADFRAIFELVTGSFDDPEVRDGQDNPLQAQPTRPPPTRAL